MKIVIASALLVATATAFVPAVSRPSTSALKAESTYTEEERTQIMDNVFECHGYFPDLREDSELPSDVSDMRKQPKSKSELADIKAKYASMSKADAAFNMLVDLGLMEDYDKLGDYSDDFADDAK